MVVQDTRGIVMSEFVSFVAFNALIVAMAFVMAALIVLLPYESI